MKTTRLKGPVTLARVHALAPEAVAEIVQIALEAAVAWKARQEAEAAAQEQQAQLAAKEAA